MDKIDQDGKMFCPKCNKMVTVLIGDTGSDITDGGNLYCSECDECLGAY